MIKILNDLEKILLLKTLKMPKRNWQEYAYLTRVAKGSKIEGGSEGKLSYGKIGANTL